ncbi:MAG: phage antirepressor KilAC domain-containing protein [Flexilinea sp.]
MSTSIVIAHPKFGEVRTQIIEGTPHYCAKDVCEVLQFANARKAVEAHCKGGKKSYTLTGGGPQLMTFIPREDVHRLVMRSNRPEAKEIQDWLAEDVLPSLQDSGIYRIDQPRIPQQQPEASDRLLRIRAGYAELLALCEEQQETIAVQEEFIGELKPKGDFYDTVAVAENAHSFEEAAKILGLPGVGRNNLIKLLITRGILQPDKLPYQRYKDRGYFRVIEQRYRKANGDTMVTTKTLVTAKGLDYLVKLLKFRRVDETALPDLMERLGK